MQSLYRIFHISCKFINTESLAYKRNSIDMVFMRIYNEYLLDWTHNRHMSRQNKDRPLKLSLLRHRMKKRALRHRL